MGIVSNSIFTEKITANNEPNGRKRDGSECGNILIITWFK
jgi:hypothetical protein